MNVLFAGTPDFAAVSLQGLLDAGQRVSAVLTQPDRPAGRGRKQRPGPVKRLALEHGIPVHQPASLRSADGEALVRALAPDVMVVAAYGLILPPGVLAVPRHGCINVHASLLPRWRGAAPIQRAILAGDRQSGVCIMRMEAGLDTGPVLATRRTPISPEDSAGDLHDRLAALGRDAALEVLAALARGEVRAVPQPSDGVTYAERIDKAEARVRWDQDARAVVRQIHAFNPAPGAWTTLPGEAGNELRLRLLRARPAPEVAQDAAPGQVLHAQGEALTIACSKDAVQLVQVQPAGGRAMSAAAFLNAGRLRAGDRLE